jgi:hypothetical protein
MSAHEGQSRRESDIAESTRMTRTGHEAPLFVAMQSPLMHLELLYSAVIPSLG